jgi:hypothetical protein
MAFCIDKVIKITYISLVLNQERCSNGANTAATLHHKTKTLSPD